MTSRSCSPTRLGNGRFSSTITADFCYVRLHGDQELYVSGYSDEALDGWASTDHRLATGATTPDGVAATCTSTSTTT